MDGHLTDEEQQVSTWDNYAITLKNYQTYLERKEMRKQSRFDLDFTDLLYASNYKGGSGSIQEDFSKSESDQNLKFYSNLLTEIHKSFDQRGLEHIEDDNLPKLKEYAKQMIGLCSEHHIKGLGVPYCSALFHLHFPNLIPVIDRNVLLGLGMIGCDKIPKSGQVKYIGLHYTDLIERMRIYVGENKKNLRDADRELFDAGKLIWNAHKSTNP
ncbi:hypothetical protein [Spirosoma areae]